MVGKLGISFRRNNSGLGMLLHIIQRKNKGRGQKMMNEIKYDEKTLYFRKFGLLTFLLFMELVCSYLWVVLSDWIFMIPTVMFAFFGVLELSWVTKYIKGEVKKE